MYMYSDVTHSKCVLSACAVVQLCTQIYAIYMPIICLLLVKSCLSGSLVLWLWVLDCYQQRVHLVILVCCIARGTLLG